MDLSKNEPQQPDLNPVPVPPAGPGYNPQNDDTAPQIAQASQGSLNYPQQPYNEPQPPQGYPTQQYPIPQAPQPYGYPQNQQNPNGYAHQQNPYGHPPQMNYGPPQGFPQNYGYGYPPVVNLAEKEAKTSWILGLIGIFIMGIVLGTIGLIKASKARSMGADATAGFILSTMAVVSHVLWILLLAIFSGDPSSGYYSDYT
jgi:hypothetical protein